jgi:glycosyltransferase involved in cell wall biosynthesis
MRGFDVFMKVAKRIYTARPDAIFLVVGSDRVCYGGDLKRTQTKSYREYVLAQDQYDLSKIWFLGTLPADQLAEVFSLSNLHIYLTVPFVLSWSLFNALACGCTVLASNTGPVQDLIQHNQTGLLADFFDVDSFAAQALNVLDDPAAYHHLAENGQNLIHQQFSLDVLLPRLLHFYQSTAAACAS